MQELWDPQGTVIKVDQWKSPSCPGRVGLTFPAVWHCATTATPLVKLKEPDTPLASRQDLACLVQQGRFGEPGTWHAAAPCQPCSCLALSHSLTATEDPLTHRVCTGREHSIHTTHVTWVCAFCCWMWHPHNEAGSYCALEAAIA